MHTCRPDDPNQPNHRPLVPTSTKPARTGERVSSAWTTPWSMRLPTPEEKPAWSRATSATPASPRVGAPRAGGQSPAGFGFSTPASIQCPVVGYLWSRPGFVHYYEGARSHASHASHANRRSMDSNRDMQSARQRRAVYATLPPFQNRLFLTLNVNHCSMF